MVLDVMHCNHRLSNQEAFELLNSALKRDGARLTAPRKLLLEAALKSKSTFSAEGLKSMADALAKPGEGDLKAHRRSHAPDLATVYRNLSYFIEIGLLTRVDIGGETAVYELGSKDHAHHHHYFSCRKCGKTELLESCSIGPVESKLKKKGYRNLSHRLELSGICPDC